MYPGKTPQTTNCYRLMSPCYRKILLHAQSLSKASFLMLCSLFSAGQLDWNIFLLLLWKHSGFWGKNHDLRWNLGISQAQWPLTRQGEDLAQRFQCPKEPAPISCQVSARRAGLTLEINTLYHLLNIYTLFHLIPSMNLVTSYCILACSISMIYGAHLLASTSEHKSTSI